MGILQLCPHVVEGAKGLSEVSFKRTLIPFIIPPVNVSGVIILGGLCFNIHVFGDTNLQSETVR